MDMYEHSDVLDFVVSDLRTMEPGGKPMEIYQQAKKSSVFTKSAILTTKITIKQRLILIATRLFRNSAG